jgi:hypothetical protein
MRVVYTITPRPRVVVMAWNVAGTSTGGKAVGGLWV